MTGWKWLTDYNYSWGFILRVLIKATVLFILINVLWAITQPLPTLGRLSLYNIAVDGRERLPYGENPAAYNLSLNNLEAMFATHDVSVPKSNDEFRVFVMGDSSVWGILLKPEETLSSYLNAADLQTDDDKNLKFYNIGHPIMSVTKDLMLLDAAMQYDPDLIIWLTTLESFPLSEQLEPPIVQNNANRVQNLINTYALPLDNDDARFIEPDFLSQTLVGQRRPIADWLRLQFFGVMYQHTGIDQVYGDFELRSNDFAEDDSWYDFDSDNPFAEADLAFDVIRAGHEIAGDVPILLVNEPIFIADGNNSDIRYNFWYPQWAYDAYRDIYGDLADTNDWRYLDVWDSIAPAEFTDSPVHLTPTGSQQLADLLANELIQFISP